MVTNICRVNVVHCIESPQNNEETKVEMEREWKADGLEEKRISR